VSHRLRPVAVAFVLAFVGLVAPAVPPVAATSITVNTATDPAPNSAGVFPTNSLCSLRAAMLSAINNTNTADADCATGLGNGVLDVIQINASLTGSTLTLAQGPLPNVLNSSNNKFQIIGPTIHAGDFTISGGDRTRIFETGFVNVGEAWFTLANLTVSHGNGMTYPGGPLSSVNGNGGAMYTGWNTHLTLDNVVMRDSSASQRGGAIFASGPTTLTNNGGSYINNHANGDGGAIFGFEGPITYNGYAMLMEGNSSNGHGGAIAYNADVGTNFTHIERSLLKNNSAANGGGVYFGAPVVRQPVRTTFELTDSTVTGSGGVFFSLDNNERFRYLRNTFQDAGSLFYGGGGFTANSILINVSCQNNTDIANTTGSRNLGSGAGCGGIGSIGSPTGVSNTLAQNGGPEVQQTYRLASTSNAIDNGDETYCGTIDARSIDRGINGTGAVNSPAHGDCDIGAYEYVANVVNFVTGTSTVNEGGGTAQIAVKLSIPDPSNRPLAAAISVPITRDQSSTARATIDYSIPPAGVTFPAGSNNNTVVDLPVTILQDDIAERNGELVIFHLGDASGVAVAEPNTHNLSIQDDDQAGVIKSDGGNGTTISEVTTTTSDSFSITLRSRPDYSQPDPNDSNSYGDPADVTVHVEPDRDCTASDGTLTASLGNPISFTILNADWQVPHSLSVNSINDLYDEDLRDETAPHSCTLEFTFDSTDPVYDSTTDRYDVNVLDNDVAGVTISQSGGSTGLVEGGTTDTYTLVLDTPPDPGKPVPATPRVATKVRATPDAQCSVGNGGGVARDFSFDGSTWSTPQTVTVTAVDDPTVELAHSCVVTHSVISQDPVYANLSALPVFGKTPATITAGVQDYDPPTITNDPPDVTVTTGGVSVGEATPTVADTFPVVLFRQPLTQNVTVTLASSSDPRDPGPDGQLLLQNGSIASPAVPGASLTLTFTPANWNVAQTVRVFAVDDDFDEASPHDAHLTATMSSTAVGFSSTTLRKFVLDGTEYVNTADIPVAIADNDTSAIVVAEAGGTTAVTEGGATDKYEVKLATHPYADVTVTVTPDAQCDVGNGPGVATTLSFPHATWNTVQPVIVTAVDDDVVELAHDCTISQVASSTDTLYDGLAGPSVVAAITDNDSPRVLIATDDGVSVAEATSATGDTYEVSLDGGPDAEVTVNLLVTDGQTIVSSGSSVPGDSVSLTFTSTDYATPQVVTVQAVDDAVDEADPHAGSIGHAVVSTATGYATAPEIEVDAVAKSAVIVRIADDDTAGVTVTESDGSTDLVENGATDAYSVVLSSEPTADVVVDVDADDQCDPQPASLTFTSADWSTAQTVTLTADDDPTVEGAHACVVANDATSTDLKYDAISMSGVTAGITDNDDPTVLITSTGASLAEFDTATTTSYDVVLGAQPLADVTINASVSDGQTALSAIGATTSSVTFTPATWDVAQTITSSTTARPNPARIRGRSRTPSRAPPSASPRAPHSWSTTSPGAT
jgi:hypothetical protein